MRAAILFVLSISALAACGSSSEPAPSGLDEPVRLRFTPPNSSAAIAGQFFPGSLPREAGGPANSIMNNQRFVFPGQQGKRVTGTAALGATGVAFKLKDIGSGYWVAPVLIPDNTLGGLLWDVQLDFGRSMPLGTFSLQVTAVDAQGHWGPMNETPLTALSSQPAGAAVATLTWDNNADLDLQILSNSGTIDAKHIGTGGAVDGGFPPGHGHIDRDSNASCVPDGLRQEDVIWPDEPIPDLYLAKVDMFSACGETATNFLFQLYVHDELRISLPGRMLSIDADNGMGPGLAITNFSFP